MRFSEEDMIESLRAMESGENRLMASAGTSLGLLLSIPVYVLFYYMETILVVFLFIPGFLIGYGTRFLGRPYTLMPRALAGIAAFILHIIGVYFVGLPEMIYLLAFVNAGVAMYFSKIKLSRLDEAALFNQKRGKISVS